MSSILSLADDLAKVDGSERFEFIVMVGNNRLLSEESYFPVKYFNGSSNGENLQNTFRVNLLFELSDTMASILFLS